MFPEEDSADSSQQDDEDSEADTEPLDTEELGLGEEQLERRGYVPYLAIQSQILYVKSKFLGSQIFMYYTNWILNIFFILVCDV
jgi:hypothetical protein